MIKTASWNGAIIAQSDATIMMEGNHYFPLESINDEYLRKSDYTSFCPWKGEASYYSLEVDGKVNMNAAWLYPDPSEKAAEIKSHVAFWNGVEVR